MKSAEIRFHGVLQDFLGQHHDSSTVTRTFIVSGSVKDLIEGCGVPHPEVAVITVNEHAVDFTYLVQDRDRIDVYPPSWAFEVEPTCTVDPAPLEELRFVVDGHLGTLARYLRLLGFDALYDREWDDPDLVEVSTQQRRLLLTRDVGLLMNGSLTRGYFVRAIEPRTQLGEVARRFDLSTKMQPFTRCMACNGKLRKVAKEDIAHRLEPLTRQHYDRFQVCRSCDRIYWPGAHHARLQEIVDEVSGR